MVQGILEDKPEIDTDAEAEAKQAGLLLPGEVMSGSLSGCQGQKQKQSLGVCR